MDRGDNFSIQGLDALYDYLEELYSYNLGEEYHLDVIELCCTYTEYDSLEQFNDEYGKDCETIDEISDFTTVIEITDYDGYPTGRFIIESF